MNETFDELRRLMKASGLSMYAIARDTGVDKAALSRFMAGDRGLSVESVESIAKLLGHRLMLVAVKERHSSKEKGT